MSEKNQRNGMVPPNKWVCPRCGLKVQTFIPTYVPWCSSTKHRRDLVMMVETSASGKVGG